jgi:hypothetical protein
VVDGLSLFLQLLGVGVLLLPLVLVTVQEVVTGLSCGLLEDLTDTAGDHGTLVGTAEVTTRAATHGPEPGPLDGSRLLHLGLPYGHRLAGVR